MTLAGCPGTRLAPALSAACSACVRKKGVFMFRSTTLSHPLSGNSSKAAPQAAPALLTRISSAGSCAWKSALSWAMPAAVDTSAGSATQGPSADNSAAVAAQASALRDEM